VAVGVFLVPRRAAKARRQRRLAREARGERVDREYRQPRGMQDELPTVAPIGIERRERKLARSFLVRRSRPAFPRGHH
jgi:hypothetical protein